MRRFFHYLSGMMLPLLCLLQACGGVEDVRLELSLSEPEVTCDAGSVFVRVLSETSWELEIVPPVDWASLQTTSGSGSKNSIILSYSANRASEARSLTVVATAAGGKATVIAHSEYGHHPHGVEPHEANTVIQFFIGSKKK